MTALLDALNTTHSRSTVKTTVTGRTKTEGGGSKNGDRKTHVTYPLKYLLITGELTTGFRFYGPFDSVEKAGRWATDNLKVGEFHRIHDLCDVRTGE